MAAIFAHCNNCHEIYSKEDDMMEPAPLESKACSDDSSNHSGDANLENSCTWTNCNEVEESNADEAARHDAIMTPLAYYMQAVMAREQEHMPLIGPSKDRQALEVDAEVWASDNVRSLICFSCAQIHTSMAVYEKTLRCPCQ